MILDEGMVWGGVLVTLCSVTSLSLGLVLVVEEGRRRSWRSRAREKISGRSFRLRAWVLVLVVGRWSRIAFPLPCLACCSILTQPEVPRNLWSSRDNWPSPLLIGHIWPSPLHPLGKGEVVCYRAALAFVTEVQKCLLLWGDSGAEQQAKSPKSAVCAVMISSCASLDKID